METDVLDAQSTHDGCLVPRISIKIACISESSDEHELMDEYAKEGIVHSLTVGAKLDAGNLTCFEGGLYFDGEINGNLEVSGTLIIGKNAVVRGNVSAANIYNFGLINANDVICDGVFVNRGTFSGNLKSPSPQAENEITPPKRKFLGGMFTA